MKGLTKRQQEIFNYIKSFKEEHGYSPSYRELMAAFSFSSLGSIAKHIKSLEEKGFLAKDKRSWRSITTLKKDFNKPEGLSEVQIIGNLSKGVRIELFVTISTTFLPLIQQKDDTNFYGFVIKDSSFHEEGLTQGDLIVVEPTENPKDGEFILATQNDGATILRSRQFHKEMKLHIYGKLVALYRLYNWSSSGSKSSSIGSLLPEAMRTMERTPAIKK